MCAYIYIYIYIYIIMTSVKSVDGISLDFRERGRKRQPLIQ